MHSSSNSRGKRKAYIIDSDDDDDEYADADTPPTPAVAAAATQPGKSQHPHSRKSHIIKSSNAKQIQNALTVWFLDGVHDARGMPWRKRWDPALSAEAKAQRAYESGDGYPVLPKVDGCVSAVIGAWYHCGLILQDRFPTVRDLAASNIEAVNALWKARLFEGAKLVVEKFDGKLPDDAALLQSDVPGIGKYSSGAICSIAYGKCVPVLDGNVHRLLSRVLALYASPKAKQVTDMLWDAAEAIVKDASDPGAVNQALIELGSTICTPRDPKCDKCPISSHCNAYKWQTGKTATTDIEDLCDVCDPIVDTTKSVTIFPMKVEKKAVPEETDVVCAIAWRPKDDPTTYYLLRKRPAT
ncbi:10335_t:CDS:2, partial [Acaulospora colombiana]